MFLSSTPPLLLLLLVLLLLVVVVVVVVVTVAVGYIDLLNLSDFIQSMRLFIGIAWDGLLLAT